MCHCINCRKTSGAGLSLPFPSSLLPTIPHSPRAPPTHTARQTTANIAMSAAVATNLKIERSKVTITNEQNLQLYEDPSSLSGNIVRRYFCKTCGSSIKSETKPADEAGMVILKLGMFEKVPEPEFEGFVKDRQAWLKSHGQSGKLFKAAVGGEKHEA